LEQQTGDANVNEFIILAAIIAPLVLVPIIIVSLRQQLDPVCSLATEIHLEPWEGDSAFARFHREMLRSIAEGLALPYQLLVSSGTELP
jgi:hypothetical protein